MSDQQEAGAIGWLDMTVGNARELRDFYAAVAGGRFCVIRDPGGSVAALYQAKGG
jgi:predicted enzyme related to lactoylglutathione lyase